MRSLRPGAGRSSLEESVRRLASAAAQSVAVKLPETPLLPQSFGEWKTASSDTGASYTVLLANVSKAALEEDNPQRSAVGDYVRAGKTVHIEAVQFDDRTGAYSAFTLVERPGMRVARRLLLDLPVPNEPESQPPASGLQGMTPMPYF